MGTNIIEFFGYAPDDQSPKVALAREERRCPLSPAGVAGVMTAEALAQPLAARWPDARDDIERARLRELALHVLRQAKIEQPMAALERLLPWPESSP